MRANHWLAATLALMLTGCAGTQTVSTLEARNALAPTGKLRVGFNSASPLHATKDTASGELKGVAVDLGKELARRIEVPLELVAYASASALIAGAQKGEWDVAPIGMNAERALVIDFTAPYMEVELSFLVPPGSPIAALSDVDRPGVRIGVGAKSSADVYLTGTIRSATLVRAPTFAGAVESLRAGRVDVLFGTKANMLRQAQKITGSRVLEGSSGGEEVWMAVPKGRGASAVYVREFVESAKSGGLVKAAIERAGLRGVIVALAK